MTGWPGGLREWTRLGNGLIQQQILVRSPHEQTIWRDLFPDGNEPFYHWSDDMTIIIGSRKGPDGPPLSRVIVMSSSEERSHWQLTLPPSHMHTLRVEFGTDPNGRGALMVILRAEARPRARREGVTAPAEEGEPSEPQPKGFAEMTDAELRTRAAEMGMKTTYNEPRAVLIERMENRVDEIAAQRRDE